MRKERKKQKNKRKLKRDSKSRKREDPMKYRQTVIRRCGEAFESLCFWFGVSGSRFIAENDQESVFGGRFSESLCG